MNTDKNAAMRPSDAQQAIYEKACAMDNQDVPLEEWPDKLIEALARAGYAVVPVSLPHELLGDAAIAGMAETGNPKHCWDFLVGASRTYSQRANDYASETEQRETLDAAQPAQDDVVAATVSGENETLLDAALQVYSRSCMYGTESQHEAAMRYREEILRRLNAQPAPKDREKDRERFTDPAFNRWLDEGISDAGHTVYDTVGNLSDAWAAWQAAPYYCEAQPAQPELCWCDAQGIGKPGVSCGDCPRDYAANSAGAQALADCPFCGTNVYSDVPHDPSCYFEMKGSDASLHAIQDAWNRRATQPPQPSVSCVPEGWQLVPKVPTASLADAWNWAYNSRCKYIDIRIDMRDGCCVLKDRHGDRITLEQLQYQCGSEPPQ